MISAYYVNFEQYIKELEDEEGFFCRIETQ